MNIISSVLILVAIVLSFVTLLTLIGWLRVGGGVSVLLPGLGLIVSTPALIVLLLILNIVVVIVAAIAQPRKEYVIGGTISEQTLEYPNDIFGGCGNGVLDLSLAKDPKTWGQNFNDRHLKACINDADLESIYDIIAPNRMKYTDYKQSEDYQKFVENNKKILEQAAIEYPMLGRINDMYEDYIFNPEEVKKLREECLTLKSFDLNLSADLALRKLIYACDEAVKDNLYLMFSSD